MSDLNGRVRRLVEKMRERYARSNGGRAQGFMSIEAARSLGFTEEEIVARSDEHGVVSFGFSNARGLSGSTKP